MANELKYATHRNPHQRVATSNLGSMEERWEAHLKQAAKRIELDQITALSADDRRLRNLLHEAQLRSAGADNALLDKIREQRSLRAKQLADQIKYLDTPYTAPRNIPEPPHVMDAPAGSGEMWWAQTSWSWNDPGIVPFWDAAAGLRFAGQDNLPVDFYRRTNLTVIAQFDLSADRVPANLLGNVISAPRANAFGRIYGATLANIFDFGDQWCKCWLNLAQTAFVHIPGVDYPYYWLAVATNSSVIQLIYIDGEDAQDNFFPGPVQMPVVQFSLGAGWDVQIDLQFWFDIQLEGDNTVIIFGNSPQFQSNLVQTFQWNLSRWPP